MKALEILQVDQPTKPWRAFAHRARALADSLACSMSDGAGPVHLNGPRKPVEMQSVFVTIDPKAVTTPHKASTSRKAAAQHHQHVFEVLERAGCPLTLDDIAAQSRMPKEGARAALHWLKKQRRIVRLGDYNKHVLWAAAPKESAA